MKMSKIILALLFVSVSLPIIAQPGGNFDPEERVKRQTERLVTALDLTPEQATQVEEINREEMQKMMEAREQNQGDREAMMEIRKNSMAERDAKFKEIFTDEQWVKYEEFKAENQGQRPGPGGPKQKKKKGKKNPKKDSGL